MASPEAELPSQRGEIWNDTRAIARHRLMTPSQRVALLPQPGEDDAANHLNAYLRRAERAAR